jgi:hypothetical protein
MDFIVGQPLSARKYDSTWVIVDRFTTGKCHSFISTDECIQIMFIGPETNEYKVIFIGLVRAPMNIWAV